MSQTDKLKAESKKNGSTENPIEKVVRAYQEGIHPGNYGFYTGLAFALNDLKALAAKNNIDWDDVVEKAASVSLQERRHFEVEIKCLFKLVD
jgi:hypothetical protein